jgi:hypothetical protein
MSRRDVQRDDTRDPGLVWSGLVWKDNYSPKGRTGSRTLTANTPVTSEITARLSDVETARVSRSRLEKCRAQKSPHSLEA